MIGKNSYLDKLNKLYNDNYTFFLKNLLSQAYKIKGLYEIKNFKTINEDSYMVSLNSSIKDIFNYQTKKISTEYLISNSINFEDKEIKSNFISQKLNNSNEENPNILFRLVNPFDEKIELKICKNSKNDKETFIQLWSTSYLINSIKLDEKGIKSIYFDDIFGKPKFSQNGKKLIFLVELDKTKNYKNFFSISNQKNSNLESNNKEELLDSILEDDFYKNTKKFEYKQEFGEQLEGKSDPVIAIYDINKNDIGFIDFEGLFRKRNMKIYPARPIFDNTCNDIIFTGYDFLNDVKLGLAFCLKRPSKIYLLKNPKIDWKINEKEIKKVENKKEENIENEKIKNKLFEISASSILNENEDLLNKEIFKNIKYNYTNIYHVLSPDGNKLFFFSNEKATPHMNGLRLNIIKWKEEKIYFENELKKYLDENSGKLKDFNSDDLDFLKDFKFIFTCDLIIDKINYQNNYFNGIYSSEDTLSKSLFISNDKIIINNNQNNKNKFYLYDLNKNILILPFQKLSTTIFDSKHMEKNNSNNIFFSMNSDVNIFPYACSWNIKKDDYESIINNIIEGNNKNESIRINEENSEKIKEDNFYDKLVYLETQNKIYTKKDLKVVSLSEKSTNEIFKISQIENENLEYLLNQENYIFSDLIESNEVNENHKKSIEEFSLQKDFRKLIYETMQNTKIEEFNYNGVFGHFMYSDINILESSEKILERPIVYVIHGGPNGNFVRKFILDQLIFLCNGYGVLVINYPGSSGYGQNYLNNLNGKIGDLDLKSCGKFLKSFVKENKNKYNLADNKTMIYGGSHGGFLGAWLICSENYNKLFSSAILRNPVTDLCSMIACSDIPDWVVGQGLDLDLDNNFPPSQELYKMLYEKSPVYQAKNAVTPTMIKLGKMDKRVNYFNGIYFYNSLKFNNCETKLFIYPEDCHPLTTEETEVNDHFSSLIWFKKHLEKKN